MIQQFRIRKKITQEKMAELTNINIRTYQKIEAEETIPLANTLGKIVVALGMDSKDVMQLVLYYSKFTKKKGKKEVE